MLGFAAKSMSVVASAESAKKASYWPRLFQQLHLTAHSSRTRPLRSSKGFFIIATQTWPVNRSPRTDWNVCACALSCRIGSEARRRGWARLYVRGSKARR